MDKNSVNSVMEKIKELVKKGNVSRILVCKDGKELVNVPVNVGIVGGVVGGFLGGLIGIGGDGWLSSILLAVGGSCVVVWLARKIAR